MVGMIGFEPTMFLRTPRPKRGGKPGLPPFRHLNFTTKHGVLGGSRIRNTLSSPGSQSGATNR